MLFLLVTNAFLAGGTWNIRVMKTRRPDRFPEESPRFAAAAELVPSRNLDPDEKSCMHAPSEEETAAFTFQRQMQPENGAALPPLVEMHPGGLFTPAEGRK